MNNTERLGLSADFNAVKVSREETFSKTTQVATEIPFTIIANRIELATFLCSPSDLVEMAYGFLFTSGFIQKASEVLTSNIDSEDWKADMKIRHDPDPAALNERMYTSGCGRGILYPSISELPSRLPLDDGLKLEKQKILDVMRWFQTCSALHKMTHGVHTAALSLNGEKPSIIYDDVGRHNAVDKVIGKGLLEQCEFSDYLLLTSGRVSSEIIHKAGKCGTPILVSLSSPTHQAVLSAVVMNITIICFARGGSFSIFTNQERIKI